MRTGFGLSLFAGLTCFACASASQPPPETRAVTSEQSQCSGSPVADEQQVIQMVQGTRVIKSQPLYSLVPTKDNAPEPRVNGATLVVQPPPGVSPATMTRALRCHSARAALGQTGTSFPGDPFVLPGTWLDINVTQRQSTYDVTIAARDVHHGIKVLENANAFAANRGGQVDNSCIPWRTADPERSCPPRPSLLQ